MARPWRFLVLISLFGCKKKDPEPVVPPPVEVNSVEEPLQIVAVAPPSTFADKATRVTIMGSGFVRGARVEVGGIAAISADMRNANELQVSLPELPQGRHDVRVVHPDGTSAVLRAGFEVIASVDLARCGYVVVYFDVDRSNLTPAAENLVMGLADCFTATSGPIAVEGHADERGTTDYNLSLGQRRAEAVEQTLLRLGVPMGRLSVTSWGEERPSKRGWGEAVWAENRRVELTLTQ